MFSVFKNIAAIFPYLWIKQNDGMAIEKVAKLTNLHIKQIEVLAAEIR